MTGRLLIVLLTRSTVVIVHAVVHPPQLSSSLPWFRRGGRRHSVVVVISAVVVLSSSLRSWRLLQCRALAVRVVEVVVRVGSGLRWFAAVGGGREKKWNYKSEGLKKSART
jgi:hypothetical protein